MHVVAIFRAPPWLTVVSYLQKRFETNKTPCNQRNELWFVLFLECRVITSHLQTKDINYPGEDTGVSKSPPSLLVSVLHVCTDWRFKNHYLHRVSCSCLHNWVQFLQAGWLNSLNPKSQAFFPTTKWPSLNLVLLHGKTNSSFFTKQSK